MLRSPVTNWSHGSNLYITFALSREVILNMNFITSRRVIRTNQKILKLISRKMTIQKRKDEQ